MNTGDSYLFHTFAEVIDDFNIVLNVVIVLLIYEEINLTFDFSVD